MAFSATTTKKTVVGDIRLHIFAVNFAGVTGAELKTGLTNVMSAHFSPAVTEEAALVYLNYSDTGSTAAPGSVYIDGVTSNDTGVVTVFGV